MALLVASPVMADRLKDLARIKGVRNNQLVGYGLVVGLDGSGDKAPFTNQTFRNMMNQFGVTLPEGVDPKLRNVAAVTVNATIPPFAKPGQEIDITVSSIGNAKSLRGGTLLMTTLKGADGNVYALAQGSLIVGGFGAEGLDGSRITVNIPSAGRIPNGATVEREVASPFNNGDTVTFNLLRSDFTTARRVVEAINGNLGPDMAYAHDATSVSVRAPRDASQRVSFLSILENIEVNPAEAAAKVVINSRTGTIVVGQNVKVSAAAVTHGNLTVIIQENPNAVQPNPLAAGNTEVVQDTQIAVTEDPARMFKFGPAVTLNEIVQAVNQVGAAPGDVMAVLEALKQAGALRAELIVI
ncbi:MULTISPECIES: flagellar basal body P-ring protein FlgI [unclassified Marinobacter]|uniref:flagellar basal body P-ring protein FlgI n=1 Tax=unclassified Marinobacter TaxID=83889 RepID=UPI00200DE842|nr:MULTISPECIES: flagellar basal body P-ring protein FlgI [unclassified Marinobacter]MCL1478697.1 flagellar basal body P-ring protein FlgI [Marinobacter sp.]MCL1484292.1 flagellar basal body P-ring protein FlgI [Marinobacter sp.]MCL1488183.1 flagellar basal body P-ring protein FlgI [Marinobacter sp.]UQG58205.1 flagellar basal body P-ring protein FlgI [Marinobacter sp. M4C]UQG67010.1 flagellar basal body P-ring protein FlgI [Marinobacter sp. M2C]